MAVAGLSTGSATAVRSNEASPVTILREDAIAQAAAADCRLPEGQSGLVATYFYYWYDLPGGVHDTYMTQHDVDASASYRNVAWFEKQLADQQAAGIDLALAVYWGAAEPSSDIGLANLGQAASNRSAAGKASPKVGMFFDTGAIAQWPVAQRDLTVQANQAKVYEMVHKFYSTLPRQHWGAIDGKPVVWFWAAEFGIKANASFTSYLRSRFAADFGVTPYLVGDYSWQATAAGATSFDNYYGWGTATRGYAESPDTIASVGPGYDERLMAAAGRSGRMTDHEGGRFYQRNLEYAIDSGKPILVLETWNEFHEASGIAETVEEGRTYIDLTRIYTNRFKCVG